MSGRHFQSRAHSKRQTGRRRHAHPRPWTWGRGRATSKLPYELLAQPNDTTCGPTCLHSVYRYFGEKLGLERVISDIEEIEGGGTLSVLLGIHALERGYRASIYNYNLVVFDPTWFHDGVDIAERLRQQAQAKHDRKLKQVTNAYIEFLGKGGQLRFDDLSAALIRRYLTRKVPILTGLSATYLYQSAREVMSEQGVLSFDDVHGEPQGHFVVLAGYDKVERSVLVADPWDPSRGQKARRYWVPIGRLINAILLGAVTYDANLLIIEPDPAAA